MWAHLSAPAGGSEKEKEKGVIIAAAKDPKTAQKWAEIYIKSHNGVVDWITNLLPSYIYNWDLLQYNEVKFLMNAIVF